MGEVYCPLVSVLVATNQMSKSLDRVAQCSGGDVALEEKKHPHIRRVTSTNNHMLCASDVPLLSEICFSVQVMSLSGRV